MAKETRYVKTYVNNRKILLSMSKCNFCPYMSVDTSNNVRCLKHNNGSGDNNFIVKCHSYLFMNNKKKPLMQIDIPKWCQLPNNFKDYNSLTFFVFKTDKVTNIYGSSSFEEKKEDTGYFEVLDDAYVDYDDNMLKLIEKNSKSNNLPVLSKTNNDNDNTTSKTTSYNNYNNYNYSYNTFDKICSCCGEKKEDVDRKEKDGMCGECFESNKKNKTQKYISYINNFRLKRSQSVVKDQLKKIGFKKEVVNETNS